MQKVGFRFVCRGDKAAVSTLKSKDGLNIFCSSVLLPYVDRFLKVFCFFCFLFFLSSE